MMESSVILSQAEAKKLIAKALNISEKQVQSLKYSYSIIGVSKEELQKELEGGD